MDEKCREALQHISALGDGSFAEGNCRIKAEDASEVELLDAYSRAVITVVDTVGPAVVGIAVRKSANGGLPGQKGAGSGTLIAPDGYLLTNDHVVQGADFLSVTLQDGTTLEATLVGTDPATDLAGGLLTLPFDELDRFFDAYGDVDAATRTRALGWALHMGVMFVLLGRRGRPSYARIGERALANALRCADAL